MLCRCYLSKLDKFYKNNYFKLYNNKNLISGYHFHYHPNEESEAITNQSMNNLCISIKASTYQLRLANRNWKLFNFYLTSITLQWVHRFDFLPATPSDLNSIYIHIALPHQSKTGYENCNVSSLIIFVLKLLPHLIT